MQFLLYLCLRKSLKSIYYAAKKFTRCADRIGLDPYRLYPRSMLSLHLGKGHKPLSAIGGRRMHSVQKISSFQRSFQISLSPVSAPVSTTFPSLQAKSSNPPANRKVSRISMKTLTNPLNSSTTAKSSSSAEIAPTPCKDRK